MACLYIDRLKNNFQRAHHFGQRTNNGEIWCPRSSIDRLCNYKCEHTPEASSNISVSVKFNSAATKIFTIGLQPDYQDTGNDYFSVIAVKELLKQYLAYLLQRYRSYFRSSSKLVSDKSCHQNMCSFNSLVSIVSKCSKEFAKNILDASKGSNHATPCCREHHKSPNGRSRNAQTLSRNIMKPEIPDEQYADHRQDSQQARKKMHQHISAVNKEDEETPSGTEPFVDHTISSDRSNASGDVYSNYDDSPIPAAKRSICVQTSRKTKSRRKDQRKKRREGNREDNSVPVSPGMPSSQDIHTIFRTNSRDFNRGESNLNLGNEFYKNIEASDEETATRNNGSPPNGGEEVSLANSIETLCDSASLCEIAKVPRTSRDFPSEEKSSETIILGNIKKRLEEDYDDYFSFDEFEVFETWPRLTPKINRTSSDSTIDYHARNQRSGTENESLTKYRKAKLSVNYSFSIHCTNSNLSHSQSSYYTPSQEQDVSPCSSVEYCSASNNSSSTFSRTDPNLHLLATRQAPQNTDVAYNCALETSPSSIRSSNDHVSSESDRMFRNNERTSETQIRRRRSSSTKHLSKLVTESFDSGVLTDYSRDHLLSGPIGRSDRSCCFAGEPSSLPTYDFDSDSSYSDDSLNRRLEVAVKQFTEDLVKTERKVRLKLRRLENPSRPRQYARLRPRRQQEVQKTAMYTGQRDSLCDFYWSHDDDKIAGSSTPPILSLSDSEIDHI